MLLDRGVVTDHTTLLRWMQAYAATLEKRVRRHLRPCTGSWRVDETYIKVKGIWTYPYRAVDSQSTSIFPFGGTPQPPNDFSARPWHSSIA